MLIVLIHNDCTGTEENANYDVEVKVNATPIWYGKVEGHRRAAGWVPLLARVVTEARALSTLQNGGEIVTAKRPVESMR